MYVERERQLNTNLTFSTLCQPLTIPVIWFLLHLYLYSSIIYPSPPVWFEFLLGVSVTKNLHSRIWCVLPIVGWSSNHVVFFFFAHWSTWTSLAIEMIRCCSNFLRWLYFFYTKKYNSIIYYISWFIGRKKLYVKSDIQHRLWMEWSCVLPTIRLWDWQSTCLLRSNHRIVEYSGSPYFLLQSSQVHNVYGVTHGPPNALNSSVSESDIVKLGNCWTLNAAVSW